MDMLKESPLRRRATIFCLLVALILGLAVVDEVIEHRMTPDVAFIGFIVTIFFMSVLKELFLRHFDQK